MGRSLASLYDSPSRKETSRGKGSDNEPALSSFDGQAPENSCYVYASKPFDYLAPLEDNAVFEAFLPLCDPNQALHTSMATGLDSIDYELCPTSPPVAANNEQTIQPRISESSMNFSRLSGPISPSPSSGVFEPRTLEQALELPIARRTGLGSRRTSASALRNPESINSGTGEAVAAVNRETILDMLRNLDSSRLVSRRRSSANSQ